MGGTGERRRARTIADENPQLDGPHVPGVESRFDATVVPEPEQDLGAEQSQKILIVEDEASLVMTLTDRLQRNGYQIESAGDGQAGLVKALTGAFDLLLLDVMLPLKSGFDICRKVRQAGLQTPILMLTARSQTIDKVTGLQFGADDYLTKPFDMMELEARIEALLRRAAPRRSRRHPARAIPSGRFTSISGAHW